jgi:hypothetical protein
MRQTFVTAGTGAAAVFVAACVMGVELSAAVAPTVPEIDASVVPAAIGALAAGILIIRARRGAK